VTARANGMTAPAVAPATLSADTWQRFRRSRLALAGLVVVVLLAVAAAGAPWLAPVDPAKQSLIEKRARPGERFLLGADEFGRDILSRIIYGSRVALLVGLLSVAIALGLGLALGCLAGFAGGWLDVLIMRGVEVLLAFPYLLLAIAVVSALGPGVLNTTIAVGIWGTPTMIRLVRGAVLTARESEYVSAARALGATAGRVLTRHVLRNILPTVIVYSTLFMANAILVEAALSFLGLGVPPPTPSWGLMVSSGRDFLLVAPHIATVPGLAIMVAVLGFNLLGDGLRDALDPRLRGHVSP
jgi:peptide/nickel transport system permease protein